MMNSSPPVRATVSMSRTTEHRRRATWSSTTSPARCPSESLISLNRSRSTTSAAKGCATRLAWDARTRREQVYRFFDSAARSVAFNAAVSSG